ncbi:MULTISPECIES: EAL domain-containing response regulator [unclassified Halomonas]|uniref:EAL domain-containing response regulator n=1 Tax=unclassified Halomonas TaxID=2609666 RepID=UPI00209FB348|nr:MULTISPECIES: EAL domain-containing protein [unclassified Halomonas]MCP1312845.1 EAL domain-containing protein [Halomonas sp. 707D7]MCP1327914.1 EAL domain-containing protein [Halomonas sp. 707D4]
MPSHALVIDDDIDIQLLCEMLLRRHGYEVETAGSLGQLARHPSLLEADLILLDLGLGEFTGLDILDYLHDLRLNAAILLISSCSQEEAAHALAVGRAKGLRMLGFLPKANMLTGLAGFLAPLDIAPQTPTPAELATAIESDELLLVYQPKQALDGGHIVGVEALVRWEHPTHGTLPPNSFIPMAEQHDMMVALTWRVLELALAQQARWHARGWPLGVAVNVDADFIKSEGVLEAFDRLTEHHGIDNRFLTLELTESVGIDCLGYARHILEALRERGCQLSLDDFGTGYSSLVQLYRLPFSELKVDRSFVSSMEHDDAAQAIALSIIDLGKRMGLCVVAEGIETEAQRELLAEAGCGVGQGYFIARPMEAAALAGWLDRRQSPAQPVTSPASVKAV